MIHSLKRAKLAIDRQRALLHCLGAFGYVMKNCSSPLRTGHTIESRMPFKWRPGTSDIEVIRDVLIKRQYACPHLPKAAETIVDAGANIGLTSLYFKERYPSARVICLEPDSSNFQLLHRNTEKIGGVTVLREALWSRNEHVSIGNPHAAPWAFQVLKAPLGSSDSVQGITVPGLMKRYGMNHIDILKMDIEGAEREVFAEDIEWINQVGVIAIELHDCINVGCARNFYRATQCANWAEYRRGEVVFMVNKDHVCT